MRENEALSIAREARPHEICPNAKTGASLEFRISKKFGS